MNRKYAYFALVMMSLTMCLIVGCSQNYSNTPTNTNGNNSQNPTSTFTPTPSTTVSGVCTAGANTTSAGVTTAGCDLLNRNANGCQSSRTAQGLSGAWLKFSCNVVETVISGGQYVELVTYDEPDYTSNYWPSSSPCYVAFTITYPDPNSIASKGITMDVPMTPNTTGQSMALGPVGIAIDGVAIYDNQAAPGDNIFDELGSFDECQGHPDNSSMYHYHTEPYSISSDDDNLIGVMRDGYFIYGRLDPNGSCPSSITNALDSNGGHTGTTVDSPSTSVYHYHLNLQSGTNTAGQSVSGWFLTTGNYKGTPGSCSY